MKILFLSARYPYPPLKGDQMRAYHQLMLLGGRHEIDLLSFVDGREPPEAAEQIAGYCRRVWTVPLRSAQMAANLLRGAASSRPFQTSLFYAAPMRAALRERLAAGGYDLVHVQLARMAPYLADNGALPRVIDLIDALSLNMARRARQERGLRRMACAVEARRLARYEQEICRRYDHALVVAPTDRAAIGLFANLHVNPLGVDGDRFPFRADHPAEPNLIFTGNMAYFPNVNAAVWFAEQVLPLIRQRVPGVRFTVAGANPHPRLQQLAAADPAITVTGYIDDLPGTLAAATVAVVPMQAGSGMQFKVLEALACGTPVVATPFALGGLEATDGEHLLVGEDAAAFAAQVLLLLNSPATGRRLALQGRALVERLYTWAASVEQLEQIYSLAVGRAGRQGC